jgi:hypothetical protein
VKRLFAWLCAVIRWLTEPRLFWIASLVLLVAFWVSFRPGTSEIQVRVSGLALQCLGVGTVFLGLQKTRKLFGRPNLVTLVKEWLSRLPRWIRKLVMPAGAGAFTVSGSVTAEGYQWSKFDPASPNEVQVAALAKNVEWLKEGLIAVRKDIASRAREQADALQREQQLRAEQDEKLRALLEVAETGGLQISFVGLVWLLFGLLLSSLPGEIAQGFH